MLDAFSLSFFPVAIVIVFVAALIVYVSLRCDIPWVALIAIAWVLVATLVVAIFFPTWVYEDCPYCGECPVSGDYCDNCGADLVDDCICGHVWSSNQKYCPGCGNERE